MSQNNDLIRRSALLSKRRTIKPPECNSCEYEHMEYIRVEDVQKAPAVDAEVVRHGIPVAHYETWCNSDGEPVTTFPCGYECPFCGDVDIKKFCPNCGAKMDAEVEG